MVEEQGVRVEQILGGSVGHGKTLTLTLTLTLSEEGATSGVRVEEWHDLTQV